VQIFDDGWARDNHRVTWLNQVDHQNVGALIKDRFSLELRPTVPMCLKVFGKINVFLPTGTFAVSVAQSVGDFICDSLKELNDWCETRLTFDHEKRLN
jgi:hypothetical protein